MRPLGRRYQLRSAIVAEVYDSGAIILTRGTVQEKFDVVGELQSTTNEHTSLFAILGVPCDLRAYIETYGRPIGTIWER